MILVGTSGWSYDDWVGPFYPVSLRDAPQAWLRYYATRFRTVEINSTFYALPDEDLVAGWARVGTELAAQGPFEFSLRMPRLVTHEALARDDVDRAWEVAARFERSVLEPLSDEGILGAVLVQLPPGFAPKRANVRALREVLAALEGRQVAIEPRDRAWFSGDRLAPDAAPLFDDGNAALVDSDGPAGPSSLGRGDLALDAPGLPVVDPPAARHAYFRFHGRREDLWTLPASQTPDGARYDYLYPPAELAPAASRAARHEAADRVVRCYFNNTPHAKGVVNAVEFRHLLGEAEAIPRPRLTEQTKLQL